MKKIIKFIKQKISQLTLVDFVIILGLGLLLLFVVFWFARTKEQVTLDLVAKSNYYPGGPPPQYWITNSIHENDQIYNEFGNLVGSVGKVENVDFGGQFRYLRVSVLLNSLFDTKTKLYKFGNQRLRVGDDLTLTIKDVKFTGTIQRIHTKDEAKRETVTKKFRVKVFMRNVPIWLIKTYDDTFKVSDSQGHQIFQIIKIISEKPSSEEVTKVEGGTIQIVENELNRNIEMEVEVLAECENDVCYFNDEHPVKINSQLWVQNNRSSVGYAIITDILSEEEVKKED